MFVAAIEALLASNPELIDQTLTLTPPSSEGGSPLHSPPAASDGEGSSPSSPMFEEDSSSMGE